MHTHPPTCNPPFLPYIRCHHVLVRSDNTTVSMYQHLSEVVVTWVSTQTDFVEFYAPSLSESHSSARDCRAVLLSRGMWSMETAPWSGKAFLGTFWTPQIDLLNTLCSVSSHYNSDPPHSLRTGQANTGWQKSCSSCTANHGPYQYTAPTGTQGTFSFSLTSPGSLGLAHERSSADVPLNVISTIQSPRTSFLPVT